MSTDNVAHMPPRTTISPERLHRFESISEAVSRFSEEVFLTPMQRHLLGLIIDETVEKIAPTSMSVVPNGAANDELSYDGEPS